MVDSATTSIVTLNVSGLNTQSRRRECQCGSKIKTQKLSTRNPFQNIKTHKLKVNGWREIYHGISNQKKTGAAILILDIILNVYAPNNQSM